MIDSVKNVIHAPYTQPVRWRWWLIALGLLTSDIVSKIAVQRYMPYGESIPFTGFFNLVHTWNTGAAFSFLANAGGWQRYFFLAVAIGASIWLASELRKGQPTLKALSYSMIMGGALGNGVDRALRGYVVDYLDFHLGGWHWPAFNIADIGIVCGAALLILAEMRQAKSSA